MNLSRSGTYTVQFQRQGFRFFKQGTVLPHATPLAELQKEDGLRLYLNTQKIPNKASPCTMMPLTTPSAPSNAFPSVFITSITFHQRIQVFR